MRFIHFPVHTFVHAHTRTHTHTHAHTHAHTYTGIVVCSCVIYCVTPWSLPTTAPVQAPVPSPGSGWFAEPSAPWTGGAGDAPRVAITMPRDAARLAMAQADGAVAVADARWLPQRLDQLDAALVHPRDAITFASV